MALATNVLTTSQFSNASTQVYTVPSGGTYARDVVITNNGPSPVAVGQSGVTYAAGVLLPVGQTVILAGQVEALYAITTASGSVATCAVGLATAFSVI